MILLKNAVLEYARSLVPKTTCFCVCFRGRPAPQHTRPAAVVVSVSSRDGAFSLLHLGEGGRKVDVFLGLDGALKLRDSVSYIG